MNVACEFSLQGLDSSFERLLRKEIEFEMLLRDSIDHAGFLFKADVLTLKQVSFLVGWRRLLLLWLKHEAACPR